MEKYTIDSSLLASLQVSASQANDLMYKLAPSYGMPSPELVQLASDTMASRLYDAYKAAQRVRDHAAQYIYQRDMPEIMDENELGMRDLENPFAEEVLPEPPLDAEQKVYVVKALVEGHLSERDLSDNVWEQVREDYADARVI